MYKGECPANLSKAGASKFVELFSTANIVLESVGEASKKLLLF